MRKQFLIALQRIITQRNTPDTIILNNGSQFKLSKATVDKAWQKSITHENVQKFAKDAEIKRKLLSFFYG